MHTKQELENWQYRPELPAGGVDARSIYETPPISSEVPDFDKLQGKVGKRFAKRLTQGGVDLEKEARLMAKKDREEREAKRAANELYERQLAGPFGQRPELADARAHAKKYGGQAAGFDRLSDDLGNLPSAGPAMVRASISAGSYINARMRPVYDPSHEPQPPSGHGIIAYGSDERRFVHSSRGDVRVASRQPSHDPFLLRGCV